MVASSGDSAAALQATASRASATDKLTASQSAVLPPPLPDQASPKSALAPPTDASLRPSPFSLHADAASSQLPATDQTASSTASAAADRPAAGGAQLILTGSPLPPNTHKSSSTAATAAGLAAASGTQAAQTGAEPKPAPASEGSDSEGQWEVVPGAEHLKQLQDAKARWLATGATCTIKRMRVRSEAELSQLHPCPAMNGLKPRQDVAVKALVDQGAHAELAEHEEAVLKSLAEKPYVPHFYGSFRTQETQADSDVTRPCVNIIMELVKGKDLASVIEAVQHTVSSKSTPLAEVAALQTWVWQLTLHVAHALAQIMLDMHEHRSHRDVKPANIMLSWQDGPLQVWLVDFASSRLHQEEHLRNGAYTPSYASPQLIEHMGSGYMPAMNDVANDIWALGAVLFELSVSAESSWMHKYGPLMFGPRPKDLKKCMKGTRDKQISRMCKAIKREQDLWAKSNGHYTQDGNKMCAQLLCLCIAASRVERQHVSEFEVLLSALMHPHVQDRMSAEQMQKLKWLQGAAAVPLGSCPSAV